MTLKMPEVRDCTAISCAYNSKRTCHALAVTIGAREKSPGCDTFFKSSLHGGDAEAIAGVGACKAAACRFNEELECISDGIHIGMHANHPDCLTYHTRSSPDNPGT